ncbi:MAG: tetraacyldisaccharide 4'-kinase [bacterium]
MAFRSRLHCFFRDIYFSRSPGKFASVIKTILLIFVPVYILINKLDRARKLAKKNKLAVPVISVGNISLGGTGKTAYVIRLLAELKDRGVNPAVLKRGQSRRQGIVCAADSSNVHEYGDEVAVIHDNFPDVPIGVGKNRYKNGRVIETDMDVDLFILDDGFQHYSLERAIDIVLLGSEDEVDGYRLPAGPLRESSAALERADFISLKVKNRAAAASYLESSGGFEAGKMVHYYKFNCIIRDGVDVTEQFKNKACCLLSTLARPVDLLEFLDDRQIEVAESVQLPDHAELCEGDIPERFRNGNLLVTEKEYVKLPERLKPVAGCIKSDLVIEPFEPLLDEIMDLITVAGKSNNENN